MKRKILSVLLTLTLCLGLAGTVMATEQTVVYASTVEELQAALRLSPREGGNNRKIILEGKVYSVGNATLTLALLENVTIQGTEGTQIISTSAYSDVIHIESCKNIVLDTLVVGHDPAASEEGCYSGVIRLYKSESVAINNCDIFGCGLVGIDVMASDFSAEGTTIRDCSRSIIHSFNANAVFRNCNFWGNGYKEIDHVAIEEKLNGTLKFDSCVFTDNKNAKLTQLYEYRGKNIPGLPADKSTFENCTFYGNGWGGDNVSTPPEIPPHSAATEAPATPAEKNPVAAPTTATVLVNGLNVPFEAYNIGGNNFFKLRDLAYVLNGSNKQFEISWDASARAVSLVSGETYTPVGGEMSVTEGQAQQSAELATSKILLDGKEVSLTAYNIGGNHYFKLRDMGAAFDFGVDWDDASKTIAIDTSKGYTD